MSLEVAPRKRSGAKPAGESSESVAHCVTNGASKFAYLPRTFNQGETRQYRTFNKATYGRHHEQAVFGKFGWCIGCPTSLAESQIYLPTRHCNHISERLG